MVLVLCLASPITDERPVLNMSVHGTMGLLQCLPDADPEFGEAIERVLTSFDARSALPCLLTTLAPMHTGMFVQALPWRPESVCSCCGMASCSTLRTRSCAPPRPPSRRTRPVSPEHTAWPPQGSRGSDANVQSEGSLSL